MSENRARLLNLLGVIIGAAAIGGMVWLIVWAGEAAR